MSVVLSLLPRSKRARILMSPRSKVNNFSWRAVKLLARGFVTDCRMDGKDRIVTFVNGLVAREVIVDIDERARRLVYCAKSELLQPPRARSAR
jgi:hypothetical protein